MATFLGRLARGRRRRPRGEEARAHATVLIVGNPNVGKSAVFNQLTGRYATVSNYPGTTVEIARGRSRLLRGAEVVDTPGMYSLLPITDEERIARRMLLGRPPDAVVHVVDAKNLQRMLGLTLQLVEAGLPVVLALNMWDEAESAGIRIDFAGLETLLGVPVVATAATRGRGMRELARRVRHVLESPPRRKPFPQVDYGPAIEPFASAVADLLKPDPAARARALLLLQGDEEESRRARERRGAPAAEEIQRLVARARAGMEHSPHYHAALALKETVDRHLAWTVAFPTHVRRGLADRLSDLCLSPWTGFPLLALVLYLGLYKFVGDFGAGTLVNLLEGGFDRYVRPWTDRAVAPIPWQPLRDLVAGEYGVVTLGIRYAVAIVLPIVGAFFLAFSLLEDSGYLPRLAMLIDRVFKKIGLSGRAVIPLVLGFGCDTMATMVTRTLETRRERIIATMLLALAIPCSAQIGVILGLLAGHPGSMALWAGVVAGVFLLTGLLAAKVLPGRAPCFYMELPPLRWPRPGNVVLKTYTRMVWYFKEVLPLFVLASVLIWVGQLTGAFGGLLAGLRPVMRALGLPEEAAVAFLFGFFRRDYGAAGLYDLHRRGGLSGNQLVVAAVTLTLFLPCIAQLLIMKKERGLKFAASVSAFIAVFAFGTGWALHAVLSLLGVRL